LIEYNSIIKYYLKKFKEYESAKIIKVILIFFLQLYLLLFFFKYLYLKIDGLGRGKINFSLIKIWLNLQLW
jgi:hypothetical protein